jgi:hypothetical protein
LRAAARFARQSYETQTLHNGIFVPRASISAAAQACGADADNGLFYARAFRKVGTVDIAYIQYRFGANELDGVLFVNGDPAIIDVDSEKFASQSNFSKDPTYAALAKKHPPISIWQLFVVEYILRDGCHACAQIGAASLNFTFDQQGRFTGVAAQPAVSRHSLTIAGRVFTAVGHGRAIGRATLLCPCSGRPTRH